jgi:two-component system response regulator RegA
MNPSLAVKPLDVDCTMESPGILLVDDSFVLRDRLALAFEERGFRVEVAGNADEALQRYKLRPTEKAVIDLRMPGRSGLTLIPDLIAVRSDVRIVILSGFGSIATAIEAIRLGAVNFLPKPADADEILRAFDTPDVAESVGDEDSEATIPTPTLAQAEWEHIHRILADCEGNISEAARRLGIHRRSLQRKLRKQAP